ncbi:MAG: helix-turn-helix transcriptional regulator [Bacteroidaceae bacterium]|nr:helix-turn-helix transcriptional regulator [Bacteroidaceae bacterium]
MITRQELTAIRKEGGLTQEEVARMASVSRLTVLKWEKGGNVRPSSAKAIREALRRHFDLDKSASVL